ncbi:MAG: alkaline shock response membrane anchor protein AmaP [Clostridia bacterium]|nr:alkaline shock response membrane anchor protein AmaP [Clostridia bacterium]
MKILEKITLILYSNIILILSVLLCLIIFGWLDINAVGNWISNVIAGETTSKIVLGVSIVFILLSIRCIFFDKTSKEQIKERQGVLMQNENGKLMISKDTIENLVSAVAKEYKDAQEVSTSVELDKDNNVIVNANLVVTDNALIKELSANLQTEIKDKVKKATDLDVKQVNIKIKNTIETKTVEPEIKA